MIVATWSVLSVESCDKQIAKDHKSEHDMNPQHGCMFAQHHVEEIPGWNWSGFRVNTTLVPPGKATLSITSSAKLTTGK